MMQQKHIKLEQILTLIKDEKIMFNFLKDLTTPKELKSLQDRLDIVFLLEEGLSYLDIAKKVQASTTTVTRVARFLNQESNNGYKDIIKMYKNFN